MTTANISVTSDANQSGGLMTNVQHLGRSLMLPIAVLPVAAILLRVGQADLLDINFIAQAGAAIFANLGMLFAVGVAVGFARANHGAAGLAGIVCYLVAFHGAEVLLTVPSDALAGLSEDAVGLAETAFREKEIGKLNVPIGILAGLVSGFLYNRFSDIRLPEFLAFFGGRRFVPIAAGFAGLFLAMVFGLGFPYIGGGLDALSQGIVKAGGAGLFIYGVLNRLLIVTGLHHILNNVAWFIVGDYNGATGDLNRFFAGDQEAGAFMSGFFPVMMFGLPAACFAMYRSALPSRRKEVGGMYLSLGLTSFLTGVTEPIEFTFMFLAPALYAIHAFLTGLSMAIMDFLQVKLGFGFSAGLFDYALNFGLATKPLLLLPVGLAYAGIYYAIFRFFITRFDMHVPGRDPVITDAVPVVEAGETGAAWIAALGGTNNLTAIDACTTRLRLVMVDNTAIAEPAMKALGARGFIRPSANTLQVVVGPTADQLADKLKAAWNGGNGQATSATAIAPPAPTTNFDAAKVEGLIAALGGLGNIKSLSAVSGRLRLTLLNATHLDSDALTLAGSRGWVDMGDCLHILIGPSAVDAAHQIQQQLDKA